MTRRRRFHLAALIVFVATVVLVGVVLGAPEPECPSRLEVCDPSGGSFSPVRMWVGVGGVLLALVLLLAGALEGAFPDRETQAGD